MRLGCTYDNRQGGVERVRDRNDNVVEEDEYVRGGAKQCSDGTVKRNNLGLRKRNDEATEVEMSAWPRWVMMRLER
jgi:hypothetical protein